MEYATRNWAIFALSVQILVIIFTSQYSIAYDFYVGGKNGWAPNPSEAFSNWASRNRFQVNDKLGNKNFTQLLNLDFFFFFDSFRFLFLF